MNNNNNKDHFYIEHAIEFSTRHVASLDGKYFKIIGTGHTDMRIIKLMKKNIEVIIFIAFHYLAFSLFDVSIL